ncbi:hypothetical protein BUE80_DR005230 [Diplocarpon rosae]|nr:hypothetical protein BUE80_DR005230 [Diplocarpon rosae]
MSLVTELRYPVTEIERDLSVQVALPNRTMC